MFVYFLSKIYVHKTSQTQYIYTVFYQNLWKPRNVVTCCTKYFLVFCLERSSDPDALCIEGKHPRDVWMTEGGRKGEGVESWRTYPLPLRKSSGNLFRSLSPLVSGDLPVQLRWLRFEYVRTSAKISSKRDEKWVGMKGGECQRVGR